MFNLSKKKIILIILIIIVIISSSAIVYLDENYYHSEDSVNQFLFSSDGVIVNRINDGYYFKSTNNSDTAIIFYPGASVEYTAYAPLMYHLAENNIDSFLIDMPLKLSLLDIDKADNIINSYQYKNYYIAGHSLGGSAASMYARNNVDNLEGIILLASYPTDSIDNNLKLLSIYGSNDGILNMKSYNSNKEYWPKESYELVIDGGNHAGFAYYGKQDGDNESNITKEIQQNITINKILEFTS